MNRLAAGPDGRFSRLCWKRRDAGRGKSELRRAVCRITSGRADSSPFDGKCHRKDTAQIFIDKGKGEKVRQERTAEAAMQRAGQTPHGARPNREEVVASVAARAGSVRQTFG